MVYILMAASCTCKKNNPKLQAYSDRQSSYIFKQNDKSVGLFSAFNTPSFLQLTKFYIVFNLVYLRKIVEK